MATLSADSADHESRLPSPLPSGGFSSKQAQRIVGITYRQLDHWVRTNLVSPSVADGKGSGTQRRFSYRDLLELKLVKQLAESGIAFPALRKAIDDLREVSDGDLVSVKLVMSSRKSLIVHSDAELFDVLKGGQGVLDLGGVVSMVSLEGVVVELNSEIKNDSEGEQGLKSPANGFRTVAG